MKNLQRVGALFVIIAATFLVYWPAQRNGFVWDDRALVSRDPLIRSWRLIPEGFRHFLFVDATASNFYRPLQRLSFTADYALWAFTPRGYHLTSIYVHIAAALALYALARKWIDGPHSRLWSCAIALLWAIHPLHTSAVTYVAGRADPLAAMFGFTALWLGLVSLDRGPRSTLAAAGATICFLAAFLSKESGAFALIGWVLVLAWRRESRAVWLKWCGLIALVLVSYSALRFTATKVPPPPSKIPALAARPGLAARALAEYGALFVAPVTLRMERDITPTESSPRRGQLAAGIVLAAAGIAWFFALRKRAPQAALAVVLGAAAYLPISNLLPLNATVAEHWLYVPSAFGLIALALTLRELTKDRRPLLLSASAVAAAWAIWLGVRTWQRQGDWFDQRTFITRTIEAGGDSARMRVNLGQLESIEGHDDLARVQFEEALKREPELSFAVIGMATVQTRLGNFAEARRLLAKAEQNPASEAECLQLRAALEYREHKTDTTDLLRRAAELSPHFWPVWRRYALALDQRGQRDEAARVVRGFLEREAFRGESWRVMGDLLANLHQPQLALAAFERAAELDLHDAEARARIGLVRRIDLAPQERSTPR